MSLMAKSTGERIPIMKEGTYQAVCTGIIDVGLQRSEKFNKTNQKIIIIWSFPEEKIKVKDEERVRVISKEYTNNLGEKSNLTKDLQAWRGKEFTEEELQGFNLIKILNTDCLMQIIHKEKNGNKYIEIASIMALPKTMEKADTSKISNLIFDFDERETWSTYISLPEWIQNKIRNADNYESSGLKEYIEQNSIEKDEEEEDKLPF